MSYIDLQINFGEGDFFQEVKVFRSRFDASVKILADVASVKMEEYAKNEAIWIDRTGNARQRLKGEAMWESKDQIMIAVSHHMDYGYWLELAHGQEYAILESAIEDNVEILYRSLRVLIGR